MKANNSTILIGAQSWAYGPAGKASAIAHALKIQGAKTVFIGGGTSYQLCNESGHFDELLMSNSYNDLKELNPDNYAAVLSVMDPFLALWAHKNNKPLFYADSMSWFWLWNDSRDAMRMLSTVENTSLDSGLDLIESLQPDQRQLVAHLLSDQIYSQGEPQVVSETEHKADNVGSMIDLQYQKEINRDTVLISLSGGISPATNLQEAVHYAEMVIDLIGEKIRQWPGASRFIITGHPDVIENIKDKPSFIEFKALNHPQFLEELNRALVVFVPCGFTTIYESLAYNTPVVFLPENHNGHVYEYLTITSNLTNKEDVFPHYLFTLAESDLKKIRPIEESMHLIKVYMEKYFSDNSSREKYKAKTDHYLKLFRDRSVILEEQQKAVLQLLPSFEGAKTVAERVLANINRI